MKRVICVIWLLAVMLTVVFAQEKPQIAVVDFTTNVNTDKVRSDTVMIRNLVEVAINGTNRYTVITRDKIDELLKEQKIAVSSISSNESREKLQLKKINYIVTGSVNESGNYYAITVSVLDVSSGEYPNSKKALLGNSPTELFEGLDKLIDELVKGMSVVSGGTIVQGTVVGPTGISIEVSTDKGGELFFQGKNIATLWDNDTHMIPIERPGKYPLVLKLVNGAVKAINVEVTSRGVKKVDFSSIAPSAVDLNILGFDAIAGTGELFPLFGVIVGQTTVQELARLGKKDTSSYNFHLYTINEISFWYNERTGLSSHVSFPYVIAMPQKWQDSGFSWERSYNGWIELANIFGWEVKVTKNPTLVKKYGRDYFNAELELYCVQNGIQYRIELQFDREGTSVNATNTLYSLTIWVR